MPYRRLYTVYTKILDVCILVKNHNKEGYKRGKKNNVIRQVIYGNFSSKKLDATKRVKKRRCGILRHST